MDDDVGQRSMWIDPAEQQKEMMARLTLPERYHLFDRAGPNVVCGREWGYKRGIDVWPRHKLPSEA